MGARIIERDEVPVIVPRGGLFYLVEKGVEKRAYRPDAFLEMVRRTQAAYAEWSEKQCASVIPACEACERRTKANCPPVQG